MIDKRLFPVAQGMMGLLMCPALSLVDCNSAHDTTKNIMGGNLRHD